MDGVKLDWMISNNGRRKTRGYWRKKEETGFYIEIVFFTAVKSLFQLMWLDLYPGDTFVSLDLAPVTSKTCKTPLRVQRSQHS